MHDDESFTDTCDRIEAEQGWTEFTTLSLMRTFLDDHADQDTRRRFIAFLLSVQQEENGSDDDTDNDEQED